MHAGTVKDAGSSLAARLQSLERSFGATGYTFTIQVSRAVLCLPTSCAERACCRLLSCAPFPWLLENTCLMWSCRLATP